ncbi:MAG: septal ring lytic transglycosylase RlpA family protein [Acidobacteria bacterium]|nr:septal ring lytic transglycosylase RlpA family protein [Acidobacteriota bacterium]
MKSSNLLVLCLAMTAFLTACGRHRPVPVATAPVPTPGTNGKQAPAVRPGYTETGYASWYGDPYHGRRAANGEVYDKNKLTAAHLTLPFGSIAKVTNLENSRSVTVRITDRGPFVKGRIIDLSQAAAREIQMIGPGTAMVRLEILSANGQVDLGAFAVQVGAFLDRERAERLRRQLQDRYGGAFIEDYDSSEGKFYRVRMGPKPSLREASQLATQLGSDSVPAFVVRLNN